MNDKTGVGDAPSPNLNTRGSGGHVNMGTFMCPYEDIDQSPDHVDRGVRGIHPFIWSTSTNDTNTIVRHGESVLQKSTFLASTHIDHLCNIFYDTANLNEVTGI